jgi:hypothetical protein
MRPLALLLVALPGADPVPPSPSIDDVIARVVAIRLQQADLAKQEATALADLKRALAELQSKLDKLNVPGPAPAPDPKPPVPVPPKPVDALAAKLKAAFDADPAETKREQAKNLGALYRAAADLAADESVATSGELLNRVATAAGALLKDPAAPARKNLADVRRAVAAELASVLPTDDALSAEQRKATAELFRKLAGILDALGG